MKQNLPKALNTPLAQTPEMFPAGVESVWSATKKQSHEMSLHLYSTTVSISTNMNAFKKNCVLWSPFKCNIAVR